MGKNASKGAEMFQRRAGGGVSTLLLYVSICLLPTSVEGQYDYPRARRRNDLGRIIAGCVIGAHLYSTLHLDSFAYDSFEFYSWSIGNYLLHPSHHHSSTSYQTDAARCGPTMEPHCTSTSTCRPWRRTVWIWKRRSIWGKSLWADSSSSTTDVILSHAPSFVSKRPEKCRGRDGIWATSATSVRPRREFVYLFFFLFVIVERSTNAFHL